MNIIKIPRKIGRKILICVQEGEKYETWMRSYLTAKEYYALGAYRPNLVSVSLELGLKYLRTIGLNYKRFDVELLLREHGSLSSILLFYRSGIIRRRPYISPKYLNIFASILLWSRIISSGKFSGHSSKLPNTVYLGEKNLFIFPVCPDYSYRVLSGNRYQYTFQGVGGGIGLVAQKALDNCKHLLELTSDSSILSSRIDIKILVGDFEAKERNLRSLGITLEEFLANVESSASNIRSRSGLDSFLFTDICGGLANWKASEEILGMSKDLREFNDLSRCFSKINHDRILISRLPLYQKWFGVREDFKAIFFEQVIEYMLMGKLIHDFFGPIACIVASDHRAMRTYYSASSDLNVLGSKIDY